MYRLYEYKSNVQLARKLKPFIERISLSFTTQNNIISALSSPIINICHLCKNTYSNESQITNIQMYEPLYRLSYRTNVSNPLYVNFIPSQMISLFN